MSRAEKVEKCMNTLFKIINEYCKSEGLSQAEMVGILNTIVLNLMVRIGIDEAVFDESCKLSKEIFLDLLGEMREV